MAGVVPEPAPQVPTTPPAATPTPPAPAPEQRKIIIRSGEMEFEVESFDAATAVVSRLVNAIKNGSVSTINSEKLANGKMKGSIVVRVPPESLDPFILDLRKELTKGGELKGQRIGSQDITKAYTDIESRLKAAKTMELRLLQIIKEGKGEIKQLLEAEKELGVWRTKIEEMEGEIRFYNHQVALSTLTITVVEKEIKAAAGLTETEQVKAGVEVEDVDKGQRDVLAAVADAKGRVTKAELKQLSAGQFSSTLNFEVAPEAAGPLRDRLRQIGRVARLDIDRVQQADGPLLAGAKVKRGDTQFNVQLYNLANVAPRETVVLQVAVANVPESYQAVRDAVGTAKGRILAAKIDENDRQNVTAQFDFDVQRAADAPVRAALTTTGEVIARNVSRAAETDAVTDTKLLYRVTLVSAARLKPRETTTLTAEVPDVDNAVAVLGAQVAEVKGRQVDASAAHERSGHVTAHVVYDVPLVAAGALVERIKSTGTVRVQQTTRDPQAADGQFAVARIDVSLSNADRIVDKDVDLGKQVQKGLSYSASVLLVSVTWVIFGLCVVLPWFLVGWGGYRILRRLFRSSTTGQSVSAISSAGNSP
ncbi:hypothetical protein FRUB_02945 [Fimbriiglobus ruber]|uniref:DUF4349 domain-containing protein n=1 Tax=Fimbriiglobus ruber TaxID=1908690 RepID=A0A225E014_9BACT|nr:hypothetical protein FRUB_02945 [Fimbriiglobus ruber]